MKNEPRRPQGKAGFTLVEVMVGLVIALLSTAIIFQMFTVFGGQRRSTVSGADAQESGLLSLSYVEREVRMAGLGTANLNCPNIRYYIDGVTPATIPPASFSTIPVKITQNDPAAGTDRVNVFYADSKYTAIPATITSDMPDSSAILNVNIGFGFSANDIILVSEGTKDCSIIQASQDGQKTGKDWNVQHNPGNCCKWNPPGGHNIFPPPSGYDPGARLSNLGAMVLLDFYVENGNLMVRDLTIGAGANNPQALIADVVGMRAAYGRDTNNDGAVDVFDNVAPVNKRQVLAVRLGVVARSSLFEKEPVSTAAIEYWPGGPTFTPSGSQRNYRYKVYNTVVPLRNVLWNQ